MPDPRETGEPIATYEELVEANLDPRIYGSCSAPVESKNRGCPVFHECRFREYRDRLNGRKGPGNIGLIAITPQNTAAGSILSCFQYYLSGFDGLRRHADVSGWVIDIVGLEGASVLMQGTKPLHEKKDPNCRACQTGTCYARTRWEKEETVPPFPRINERAEMTTADRYAMGYAERMRQKIREKLEHERMADAFRSGEPPPAQELVPAHEAPGTGRLKKSG